MCNLMLSIIYLLLLQWCLCLCELDDVNPIAIGCVFVVLAGRRNYGA